MNRQDSDQDLPGYEDPPTYQSVILEMQINTPDDTLQTNHVLSQSDPLTEDLSSLNNAVNAQVMTGSNITYPAIHSGSEINSLHSENQLSGSSTNNTADLPPSYETLFPSKKSCCITMLNHFYKGVCCISSYILTALKYIFNLFRLENFKKIPYHFIFIIIMFIFDAYFFRWLVVFNNEFQRDFIAVNWFLIDFFNIIAILRIFALLLLKRDRWDTSDKKILVKFIAVMTSNFSWVFIFFLIHFNDIERLYCENKL